MNLTPKLRQEFVREEDQGSCHRRVATKSEEMQQMQEREGG